MRGGGLPEPPPAGPHPPFPAARGARRDWDELPLELRAELERGLGDSIVAAESIPHGFSPGVAARIRLARGGSAFVKALSAGWNPDAASAHRREARITPRLPPGAHAPQLLLAIDAEPWIALAFEDVGGRPPDLPWRPAEVERVTATLADLAVALTPSPVELAPVIEAEDFSELARLAVARDGGDPLGDLDPWLVAHLDRLVELEAAAPAAAAGDTLLHADIRADNVVLTDQRVWLVDWPHAGVGAAWVDLLAMLPSVAMQGGPGPEAVFADHPVATGADPEAVTAVVAALAGFFIGHGREPELPELPGLRVFQRRQGTEALRWLRQRTGT